MDFVTTPERVQLMADMSLAADRPLNWNLLGSLSSVEIYEEQLAASDLAASLGAHVVALTLPWVGACQTGGDPGPVGLEPAFTDVFSRPKNLVDLFRSHDHVTTLAPGDLCSYGPADASNLAFHFAYASFARVILHDCHQGRTGE